MAALDPVNPRLARFLWPATIAMSNWSDDWMTWPASRGLRGRRIFAA